MRKAAMYLLLSATIILLLVAPAAVLAESMPGMDMGESTTAAAGSEDAANIDHQNYKPPEGPAEDSSMAAIVSTVFALPIAGWLVTRSLRKAKKNSK